MITFVTSSRIKLEGYDIGKLRDFLSYTDKQAVYKVQRFKKAYWFVNKYGREKYEEELQRLKSLQKVCLLEEVNGEYFTYSGLAKDIDERFGYSQTQLSYSLPSFKGLPWDHPLPFELYQIQKDAIASCLSYCHGTVVMATGLGKSICILSIAKTIGLKTVVITPSKSIAHQLYKQFVYHLGKKWVGLFGDGKKEYDKLIVIAIDDSLAKVKDKSEEYEALSKTQAMIVDECFPYETGIWTKNGVESIGSIYNKIQIGENIEVLSYNERSKMFEYKKVSRAFKKAPQILYKIKTSNITVEATGNHLFLTKKGWVQAKDLKINDYILNYNNPKARAAAGGRNWNDDQMQVLFGSYLGDGHVGKFGERFRLSVIHGAEQENYLRWKASIFGVKNVEFIPYNGYSQKPAFKFTTKTWFSKYKLASNKSILDDIDSFKELLNNLDWRGIAIWYMDDGSKFKSDNGCVLNTHGFPKEKVDLLTLKLNNFGIRCSTREVRKNSKIYYTIYVHADGFRNLIKQIAPYIHVNLTYKIPQNTVTSTYKWNQEVSNVGESLIEEIIIKQFKKSKKEYLNYLFDLEVEDNHTYLVSNGRQRINGNETRGGLIVHNCHHTPAETLDKVCSKLLANAPYRYFFTASPFRADGGDLLLKGIIGPTLVSMDLKEAVDKKYLAKPNFIIVGAHSSSTFNSKEPLAMYKHHIYNNAELHATAADWANKSIELLDHQVLILIDHVEQFKYLLPHFKYECGFAHGPLTSKNQKDVDTRYYKSDVNKLVERFNKGELKLLVGTSCISEGTDIKPINTLINLQAGTSTVKFMQSVGRATRLVPGKTEFNYVDFNIKNIPLCYNNIKTRIALFRGMYDNIRFL